MANNPIEPYRIFEAFPSVRKRWRATRTPKRKRTWDSLGSCDGFSKCGRRVRGVGDFAQMPGHRDESEMRPEHSGAKSDLALILDLSPFYLLFLGDPLYFQSRSFGLEFGADLTP